MILFLIFLELCLEFVESWFSELAVVFYVYSAILNRVVLHQGVEIA